MFNNIINWIWSAIDCGFDTFIGIYDNFFGIGGGVAFILGIVTISAIYKYILSPYLSGSGSDNAKAKKGEKDK